MPKVFWALQCAVAPHTAALGGSTGRRDTLHPSQSNRYRTPASRASTSGCAMNACRSTGSPVSATRAASSMRGATSTTTDGPTARCITCRRPSSQRVAACYQAATQTPNPQLRLHPETAHLTATDIGGSALIGQAAVTEFSPSSATRLRRPARAAAAAPRGSDPEPVRAAGTARRGHHRGGLRASQTGSAPVSR